MFALFERPVNKRRVLWWAAGIAAGITMAVFVGWALLVPAADWLARHDVGSVVGPNLETARNNARGSVLTLAAGLAATGAVIVATLNFRLQRQQLQQTRAEAAEAAAQARRALEVTEQGQWRTLELTEQGQVTERFTRAVEQLGSEKPDVRLGGVYALERIMIDSARDHPTIVELLAAFVREHAGFWPPDDDQDPDPELRPVAADVLAAVNVLVRRPRDREERVPVNLSRAILIYVDFAGADLSDMVLSWANLEGATFTGADLTDAKLQDAKLDRAVLIDCTMIRADLSRATLYGARLEGADFTGADLTDAIATGVDLSVTNLTDDQKDSMRSM
jgi:hypothetical protein